jgi:hypothetical protein
MPALPWGIDRVAEQTRTDPPTKEGSAAAQAQSVWAETRFSTPARSAAIRQASDTTFGVTGLSARQFWIVPGKSHVVGFIHRQCSLSVAKSVALRGTTGHAPLLCWM